MTMNKYEAQVLRDWAERTTSCGTIQEAVKALASVAMKEAAIKSAQASPPQSEDQQQ